LAVAPVAQGAEESTEEAAGTTSGALIEAEQLTLPYELPA
jgi:hypothetical protein